MCRNKNYDPKWYLDSIDAIVDSIETNIAYLKSVESGIKGERHQNCLILIEKYESMRNRVLALKTATPVVHYDILNNLGGLQGDVIYNRENLKIGFFYFDAVGTSENNLFIKADKKLKRAEDIIANPPRNAKIHKDFDCMSLILRKERETTFHMLIKNKEYREDVLDMMKRIDAAFDAQNDEIIKTAKEVDECVSDIASCKNKVEKAKDIKNKDSIIAEVDDPVEESSTEVSEKEEKLACIRKRLETLKAVFFLQKQAWESHIKPVILFYLNESKLTKFLQAYDSIKSVIKIFGGYLIGSYEEDVDYDFEVIERFLRSYRQEMENEVSMANEVLDALIGTPISDPIKDNFLEEITKNRIKQAAEQEKPNERKDMWLAFFKKLTSTSPEYATEDDDSKEGEKGSAAKGKPKFPFPSEVLAEIERRKKGS